MKVKNVSGKLKNFKVGKEWVSVEPEETIEVANNVIQAEEGLVEVKSKSGSKEGYSKTDIKDMKKDQQVEILKSFGLNDKEIKELKNEKNRVNKILKLQK